MVLMAPPLLLWAAWRSSSTRFQQWLLTAFVTIYGATIGIAFDPEGAGPDGVRHLLRVHTHYVGLSFPQYLRELSEIVTFQLTTAPQEDVFIHTLSYIAGGVIGIPELFFPAVAFVYGYAFTGSMLIIFRGLRRTRIPFVVLFLFLTFFLVTNIEGVQSVRMWTGLWVLVYAALRYYQTRSPRHLLLLAVPPFIHFSYFVLVLPAYVVLLFGSRPLLYTVLFVASSVTAFVDPATVQSLAQFTPRGEQSFRSYYRPETGSPAPRLERSLSQSNRIWHDLTQAGVQRWALNVFIATMIITGVYPLAMTALQRRLFSTGLLTLTLSNATWFISSLENRAWTVGIVFIGAAFIMMTLSQGGRPWVPRLRQTYASGLLASAILFVPYVAFNLSTLLDYPSVFLLVAPFVVWIDPSVNVTMKEALQFVIYSVL